MTLATATQTVTAQQLWNSVVRFLGTVSLNEPDIIQDKERVVNEMQNEIAFIDMSNRQIKVNYPKLVKDLGPKSIWPVLVHEALHHKFCPYDLKTAVTLLNESDKVFHNIEKAKFAENIFSDSLVNTYAVKKGDKSIVGVYKALGSKNPGDAFWNLYMRTYERLWNLPKFTLAKQIEAKTDCDAKKLEEIVSDVIYRSDKWPKAMNEFAKVIKDYIKENHVPKKSKDNGSSSQQSQGAGQGQSGQGSSQKQSPKPSPIDKGLIDQHSPKDFAPKGKDKASYSQTEKELRGLAKQTGNDPKQYGRIVSGLGLGSGSAALKWFYRDLASCFDIRMPSAITNSGSYPQGHSEWDLDDDENELDVAHSISQYGAIVPGYTTFKQIKAQGDFGKNSTSCPDLLLCIDSSISMPEPKKELSPAVLSAMVASKKALSMDRSVAVLNFSDRFCTQEYTRDKELIDDMIVKFTAGGTVLPGEEIKKIVLGRKEKQHILIITDAEIEYQTLMPCLGALEEAVQKGKAGGTVFLINSNEGASKQLEKIGYNVIRVTDPKQLVGLTLNEASKIYGG
jgi:hypothetical protein